MSGKRLKELAIAAAKLLVAAILVSWMVNTGKIDAGALREVYSRPSLIAFAVMHWLLCGLVICAYRWWLLLKGLGVAVPLSRILNLQLIGMFFNSAMPGAVGGDLVKAVYVVRDDKTISKSAVMLSIILDRVIGLAGLLVLGCIAIALNFEEVASLPALHVPATFIAAVTLTLVGLFVIVLLPRHDHRDPFLQFLRHRVPGFGALREIYVAFSAYRNQRSILFSVVMLSVFIQLLTVFYFIMITKTLTDTDFSIMNFVIVFPIGIMTTALPLSPGGLGVGHVAFEQLFKLIGLTDGANVFNNYILLYIVLSLTGAVPYLTMRRKRGPATEPESPALAS